MSQLLPDPADRRGFPDGHTASGLAIDYGGGLIRIHRDGAAIVVRTQEVRHLLDALVEGATWTVNTQV